MKKVMRCVTLYTYKHTHTHIHMYAHYTKRLYTNDKESNSYKM
jgi:hypothetical protein